MMEDPAVSEIMINGPDRVYVERAGQIERTEVRFETEQDLLAAAQNIAQFIGQEFSDENPVLDGRLPDGSRVCIVRSPVATDGTSMNIRRFSPVAHGPEFLLDRNAITPVALEFLLLAVATHRNILVSGGTGSGKTTLLNVLSSGFSDRERIVVIEDTQELQIPKEHVVRLEARPADSRGRGRVTVRDLFVASLRMRPDRIIIGEVRRGEALDMVQAMTSGHRGSMATLHASTPSDACHRLETMALMADVGLPLFALRRQVASALDLIVQTNRLPDGRRLITEISEVDYDEPKQAYALRDIFSLPVHLAESQLAWTGVRPRMADDPLLRLSVHWPPKNAFLYESAEGR
ncbi:MAG TPA: ATPase, T2SS/T4P/T4SS family [Terriglobales bacterium]|nr:ATPase, T2SS/T4P/T4SS family [Terriglobales bacterium]